MSNYYKPKLEELYFGMEVEILSSYGWIKGQFPKILDEDSISNLTNSLPDIRVKYLDKEDIESLGFEDMKDEAMSHNYGYLFKLNDKNNTLLKFWTNKHNFNYGMRITITDLYNTLFVGNIKNKSELIKLLEQLNIKK